MLLFPFPAFVIAKVDPKTSTNTEDYLTHMVVFTEDDERVDYYRNEIQKFDHRNVARFEIYLKFYLCDKIQ